MTVHGHQVAAYRDETGVLHTLDPACRHMGCIVNWDPAERAWACPCRGSRDRARDRAIHGLTWTRAGCRRRTGEHDRND